MAATTDQVDFQAKLYRYSLDTTKSESTIETAVAIATNEVVNVLELGTFSIEGNTVDAAYFGDTYVKKLMGMSDLGTYDISIGTDNTNTLHKAIRDDDRKGGQFTYALHLTDGTNSTYIAFDGFIGSTAMNTSKDDVSTMDVSIVITSAPKFVDNS